MSQRPVDENTRASGADPLVSVIMPVFNAGRYLRPALRSILWQSFQDWELILIDDGSTDGAVERVADILDSRVRVVRDGKNLGLAERLNQGVAISRGRYVARMDGDDIAHPERFARQLEALRQSPELDLVGARCLAFSENQGFRGELPGPLDHAAICARPWLGFYLPHPTWMGKREWFLVHRYKVPAPYRCEDQELLLRASASSRYAVVDRVLLAYRVRDVINLKVMLKTRLALCREQVGYFVGRRRFALIPASILAAMARAGKDVLAYLQVMKSSCPNKTVPSEWEPLMRRLED